MGIATRSFFKQPRPANQPLRLEDIFGTPEGEDAASDYNSDMGAMPSVDTGGGFQPPQQSMPAEPQPDPASLMGLTAPTAPTSPGATAPNNQRLATAQSLLEEGDKPFANGAGWWGVADRLAKTGVGAYMEGQELDRKKAEQDANTQAFVGSLDQTDPVHRMISTVAKTDLNRASDLLLKYETQKQIKSMANGYKQRTYNNNGQQITEQSSDGGKTWTPLATSTQFKPADTSGDVLTDLAVDQSAKQFVDSGDMSVFTRLPFKEAVRVRNRIAELLQNATNSDGSPMTPAQMAARTAQFAALKAGLRSSEIRQTNIDTIANEADSFADQALQFSQAIPRGQWVPINRLQQNIGLLKSDPRYFQLVQKNVDLAHAMAGVAGRGTTNQHLQEKYEQLLNTAASPAAYAAQIAVIKASAKLIREAPTATRDAMVNDFIRSGVISSKTARPTTAPAETASPVRLEKGESIVSPTPNQLGYIQVKKADGTTTWRKPK